MPSCFERWRTTDSAAAIDSFITSPSLPVDVVLPLPGSATASIVSRSPPTSVHARPVTWPTWFFFSAMPYVKRRTPRYLSRFFELTSTGLFALRALPSVSLSSSAFTTLRQILLMSRSRLRTPASRV